MKFSSSTFWKEYGWGLIFKSLPVLALLLIIILANYMWPFSKKSNEPKVVETKTFSCPGMTEFTFKYPVFAGFEVENISSDRNECIISLSQKKLSGISKIAAPDIRVEIKTDDDFLSGYTRDPNFPKVKMEILSNPQGMDYYAVKYLSYPQVTQELENPDEITFQISMKKVVSISVPDYSDLGFNRSLFFQTVIESFRLSRDETTDK